MAKVVAGLFTRYEFAEDEVFMAQTFSDLNLQFIQNELAIAAEQKANLYLDPDKANSERTLALEIMYAKGKMDALASLLATHRDTQTVMQEALQEEIDLQQADNRR